MKLPTAVFRIVKEAARHLLKRPVIGIAAAARTPSGHWLLIRRGDTGGWALPGGTLEWGETLRAGIARELEEETGAKLIELGRLVGVYSGPDRDLRFHAVTVVVEAKVSEPTARPDNPVEILEVRSFADADLPGEFSYSMKDMLDDARFGRTMWE